MNEHDSKKIAMLLQSEGYVCAGSQKEADIVLFNTCTIREKSHHKAVSEVGKALKSKRAKPHLIVGIAGCVAQEEGEEIFNLFPELDIAVGPDQIHRLPEMLRKASGQSKALELVDDPENYQWVGTPQVAQQATSINPFVTIMKGCNNFCTFCIVPYVRGREVSRPPSDIIDEIKSLIDCGAAEVTLLGQNVNSYGGANPEYGTFPELIRKISNETKIKRIRYTSPHPKDLSDELILEHKTNPLLCENIHLPVQSGSTPVLKRMNRKYTREDFVGKIDAIRRAIPDIAVSTDMIVGFPGETEEEFEETVSLMNEVEFDGMFAFRYSERPGTGAAKKYKDDVHEKTKLMRLTQVLELNEIIVLKKNEKYVGTVQEVLVEGSSRRGDRQMTGRTRTNKIVNFEGESKMAGKLVHVSVTWAGPNSLKGEVVC